MRPKPNDVGPGQESVWDYPRPPRLDPTDKHIRVIFDGVTIADTTAAIRCLETSHPPVYYIPPQNIRMDCLLSTSRRTICEFKGQAFYWSIRVNEKTAPNAVWGYLQPQQGYEAIKGYLAFYPQLMDACYVDDELVKPQPGNLYGGWITSDIIGPFKGKPGTMHW